MKHYKNIKKQTPIELTDNTHFFLYNERSDYEEITYEEYNMLREELRKPLNKTKKISKQEQQENKVLESIKTTLEYVTQREKECKEKCNSIEITDEESKNKMRAYFEMSNEYGVAKMFLELTLEKALEK